MRFFRPFLLVLLTVWLALPLVAPAQSATPPSCHGPNAPRYLSADDAGCAPRAMPAGMAACCHFYATTSHANVGDPPLAPLAAVQVGHEPDGQPQYIPPVATRPPPA
ncbi:hypothetical protein [Pseudogulbenkiania sp. MAI-1]|uniref:hypothetical protein n=1 Tax=Pseudogulbenkiania sp. MAI-1 TaxID=990370 RepID=UPI0004AF9E63|nr:hypothetical protein [Pseudogulbenkiania sp. MAI-1]